MVSSYQEYEDHLDRIGEAILTWADTDKNFRGYTEVSNSVTHTKDMRE
jgi:hypothetical protein